MSRPWRGVTLDDRSADMMDEVNRLTPDAPIDPTQGSYSGGVGASAGTHDGCGAIDIAAANLAQWQRDQIVNEMRRVGWAAWLRTPAQSDWPFHIHGIAVQPGGKNDRGCLSSGAHDQIYDYYAGRNGLASNAPDDGTRQFVGVTWESYLAAQVPEPEPAPPPEEGDNMWMVIRDPSGAAWCLCGAYVASGVYSAEAIIHYEAAGVPIVDLPASDFNAHLKGREMRTV